MNALDLQNLFFEGGASHVGFADLTGTVGRAAHRSPRAISFAMPIAPPIVSELLRGPSPDYRDEYRRLNGAIDELAHAASDWIRKEGHEAQALEASSKDVDWKKLSTPLPHKTVALLAGLGWIGRSGLLVTADRGPAVRLGTVLTDAPLPCARAVPLSHCGSCRACADACPASAISGRLWSWGMDREELYDAHACFQRCRKNAESGLDELICGLCIAACPLSPKTPSSD